MPSGLATAWTWPLAWVLSSGWMPLLPKAKPQGA